MNNYFKFQNQKNYESFFKSGKTFYFTSDGNLLTYDGVNINSINIENRTKGSKLNEKDEEVTCFVANPADKTVIIARSDLTLRKTERNTNSKDLIWNSNHNHPITSMALDNNSKILVTGSADHNIRISYIKDKEMKSRKLSYHKSMVNILKYHPKKDIVVSCSCMENDIVIWETKFGKMLGLCNGHFGVVTSVEFHVDSNSLISSSKDETIIIWDMEKFSKQIVIPVQEIIGSCVLTSPRNMNLTNLEDEYLIMCGGQSGVIKIISPSKQSIVKELRKASLFNENDKLKINDADLERLKMIRNIISVDNYTLVMRECDSLEVYDQNMVKITEFTGLLDTLSNCISLGNKNEFLLVTEGSTCFRLFDMRSDDLKSTLWPCTVHSGGHYDVITSIDVFGNNNNYFITGGKDGRLCLWVFNEEEYPKNHCIIKSSYDLNEEEEDDKDNECFITCIKVDYENKLTFVHYSLLGLTKKNKKKSTYHMRILKIETSKSEMVIKKLMELNNVHDNECSVMDVNEDGEFIASGSSDKTAKVWQIIKSDDGASIQTKWIAEFKHPKGAVWSVQFSHKRENQLLTGSGNGEVSIWSLITKSKIHLINIGKPVFCAFYYSDENYFITLNNENEIQMWDIKKKKSVFSVENKSEKRLNSLNPIVSRENKEILGLIAFGSDSLISIYKNVSAEYEAEKKERNVEEINLYQDLLNAKKTNNFKSVFMIALKLSYHQEMYKAIEELSTSKINHISEENEMNFDPRKIIGELIDELDEESSIKLFKIATNWMMCGKRSISSEIIYKLIEKISLKKFSKINDKDFRDCINTNLRYLNKKLVLDKSLTKTASFVSFAFNKIENMK